MNIPDDFSKNENEDMHERKWADFTRCAVIMIFKYLSKKEENFDEFFKVFLSQWEERQHDRLEKELSELLKGEPGEKEIMKMLFGSVVDPDKIREKHKKVVSQVVAEIESIFIAPEG